MIQGRTDSMLKKDAYKMPGVHEGFEARGTDFQTEDQERPWR